MQLALDNANNDLIKGEYGGVVRVADGRFVIQQVKSKLNTVLGEWLLNPDIGWINSTFFVKNANLYDIESRAREIILGTDGVLRINELITTMTNRTATLVFSADTVYGGIDLTVPWDITTGITN
jgi:hypothetical protein